MQIPGWNLGITGAAYLATAAMLSAVFHELGHALCAASLGVPMLSCGVFLLIVWPGAFVQLDDKSLARRTPSERMRISSAGIWHNVVLAVAASAAIRALPTLLAPAYANARIQPMGVVVVQVDAAASPSLLASLQQGDRIVKLNRGGIAGGIPGWKAMLEDAAAGGAGTADELVGRLLPSRCASLSADFFEQPQCDSARDCPRGQICMAPRIARSGDRILHLDLCSAGLSDQCQTRRLTFVGDPHELAAYVLVSEHVPRHWIFPLWLPVVAETLLRYVVSLNAALAVLNAVPAFDLDGQRLLADGMRVLAGSGGVLRLAADGALGAAEHATVAAAALCLCLLAAYAVVGAVVGG
ncbi:diphosphomevalonate decarboxylase [Polyrhizophydium stewartii]|uniref:Endopeptidase S2P n=1 Tax=Polyrhizophydium stewartii TaxID=2732419 RepID=A0ABR4N5A8_9FUNG